MTESTSSDSTDQSTSTIARIADRAADLILLASIVSLIAVQPVAAQSAASNICGNKTLSQLFSGAFSLLTALGILMGLAVYKYQYVVGIVSQNPSQQEQLKQRKQQVKSSAVGLIAIDALYIVGAPMMGLPQFGCIF